MSEDIAPGATVGYTYDIDAGGTSVGADSTVRSGSIIYADVEIGRDLVTGHNVLIRENTEIGDHVVVGTNTVIDGHVSIGSHVSLQTGVYIPKQTTIRDRVFIGPCAVLTNDPYPIRSEQDLTGPTIEDDVSIGANATILPGITIGSRSFVAAGSVVTGDVPPETLAIGVPARHEPLPDELARGNDLP